ncbi:MAG TPA: hypothetical protein VJ575_00595 [Pseudogulbenkiania sp.]|nr:hypothetical protein [Pseudogulbenkiania sp.]
MRYSLCWFTVLCGCFSMQALAKCPEGVWMCATPGAAYAGKSESRVAAAETVVLKSGAFALEQIDSAGGHGLDLRPSWRLDEDTHLSLKVSKHQTELRLKWQW